MALREHLFSSRTPTDPDFRWRGGDVSRIEGLSDAAFAFAMAMLVVDSFQDIRTYKDLLFSLAHVPALMACFAILMWLWGVHYKFFRRFGLEDNEFVRVCFSDGGMVRGEKKRNKKSERIGRGK